MLPGSSINFFGKPDFMLLDPLKRCLDLKTSKQLPSEPKDAEKKPEAKIDHAIAASIYACLRKEKQAQILYVSTAEKPRSTYRLITLGEDEIAFFVSAASQVVRQIEATLTAAIAWSEFELVSPEEALAQLCRPNLLAQGGGTYPIWKPDYSRRVLDAVTAWN
jgi:DNA-binding PadR family transcriptional regulator